MESSRGHSDSNASNMSFTNDFSPYPNNNYDGNNTGNMNNNNNNNAQIIALKASEKKCKELESKINILQSELNNENEHDSDQIMSDLISYKMQYALTSSELEEEKKKNKDNKTKLQTFARRISALENALSDANEQTTIANEPKGMFSYFRKSSEGSVQGSVAGGSVAGSTHGGNTPYKYGQSPGITPTLGQGGRGGGSVGVTVGQGQGRGQNQGPGQGGLGQGQGAGRGGAGGRSGPGSGIGSSSSSGPPTLQAVRR